MKSADRVLTLLEQIAGAHEPPTLPELQDTLAIPKSSLHALLATMEQKGWIEVTRAGGYGLGAKARTLWSASSGEIALVEVTNDVLTQLRDELDETVHLAVLTGPDVTYLASRFSPHALSVGFHPGRRLPAHITALGKAMLAECEDLELSQLSLDEQRPTPMSIHSREEMQDELTRTRERGYAIDNQETAIGLRCFAVAIYSPPTPLHAISCSTPIARLNPTKEALIVTALLEAQTTLLRLRRHADRGPSTVTQRRPD